MASRLPPNELRLSCGAKLSRSQTQFYHRRRAPSASGALGSTAQEPCRQPRATPAPKSTPTPASPQMSRGVMGVWRLATAIGAAIANPIIPPPKAPARSSLKSQWNLDAAATEAVTPNTPPTIAPTKSPPFPTPFPRIEPITAPSPASIQAARNTRRVFNEICLA